MSGGNKCCYHVAITQYLPDLPEAIKSIEFDLSEQTIQTMVTHYEKFEFFICEHRSFHPAYITQIVIYLTNEEIKILYEHDPDTKKENKNSWKWNNLVLRHGKDVTDRFLNNKIYDQSLLEAFKFAKNQMITNSINRIHDFSKVMIPLGAAFLTAYFALLKFLGLETINSNISSSVDATTLMYAPIFFIFSVVAFAFGAFPAIFFGDVYNTNNVKGFRKSIFVTKYSPIAAGLLLFILGLWFMVTSSMQVLMN